MVAANRDPSQVLAHIIYPVRNGLAYIGVDKIINVDGFWFALRLPLDTPVQILAHKLFLLGVHANDWQPCGQRRPHLLIDVLELRVPIRVACAFLV